MPLQTIDHRRHYILMLDTETANTIQDENGLDMSNVLVYDCGWAVIDTAGHLYETASYVNREIFNGERDLMRSAYYAHKIPIYVHQLRAGTRQMADWWEIRRAMLDAIQRYGIVHVCAHNSFFDNNALNKTTRYLTASKYRFFFPFGSVEFWDTMKMAQDVICTQPTYVKFCEEHGYLTDKGKPRKTAEILYRYISGDNHFVESHTGLEDVLIECEILWYCFRQHKAMRKELFTPKEWPKSTDFQRELMASLKRQPTIRMG